MKHRLVPARTRFVVPRPAVSVILAGPAGRPRMSRAKWTRSAAALVAGAAIFSAGPLARAATEYWEPTGTTGTNATGSWSTATTTLNWNTDSTGVATPQTFWTNGNDAIFSADAAATALSTVTLSTAISANSLTFGNGGAVGNTGASSGATGGYTFTNGSTLTLGTTATSTIMTLNSGVGAVTFQGAVFLSAGAANTVTINDNSSNALLFSGTVNGGGTGGTTLALTGTGTGGVTFNGVLFTNSNSSGQSGYLNLNIGGSSPVTLNAANLALGVVAVGASSTLNITNALALQGFNLNTTTGSTVNFGTAITAATIAGLSGSGNLTLSNTAATPAAVALTLEGDANNNSGVGGSVPGTTSPTYSGNISGLGGVTITSVTNGNRANGGTETLSGALSFSGGLSVTNTGSTAFAATNGGNATVVLQGADTYTGATSVSNAGTLTISASGSTANTSGYSVSSGGILQLTPGIAMTGNQLNSAANVTLNGVNSTLALTGNTTNSVTDTFNALVLGQGNNTVAITGAAGKTTTLAAGAASSSFQRTGVATALILGTNLGQGAATGNAVFTLGDAGASLTLVGSNTISGAGTDTTQGLKIVPYLFGSTSATGTGTNFVTYDGTYGLRTLVAGEDTTLTAAAVTAAAPVNALGFSGTVTSAAGLTVNSLLFNTATQTLNGSGGALTINSGALAITANTEVIGSGFSSLALGNGEGVITTVSGDTLTINTPISVSSSGGLTKTGAGTLVLGAGTSTYPGATTVNQGTLTINAGVSIASSSGVTVTPGAAMTNNGTIGALTTLAPVSAANGGTTVATATLNGGSVTGAITDNGTVVIAGTTAVTTGNFNGSGATGLITYTNTLAAGNTLTFSGTNSFSELNNTAAGGVLTLTGAGSVNTFTLFPEANAGPTTASTKFVSGTYIFATHPGANVYADNLGTFTVAGATVQFGAGLQFVEGGGGTVTVSSGELSVVGTFDTEQQTSGTTINFNVNGGGMANPVFDVTGVTNFGDPNAESAATNTNLNISSGGIFQSGVTSATARNVTIGGSQTFENVAITLAAGGTILANGTIQAGGAPSASGTNDFNWTGGTLTATAINMTNLTDFDGITTSPVAGTLYNGGGTLAPGFVGTAFTGATYSNGTQFTGKTTITGNYQVDSPNAALAINLGGTTAAGGFGVTANDYDNVSITGTAVLGGKLNVNLVGGFLTTAPSNISTFTILQTGKTVNSLAGMFTNTQTSFGGMGTLTGGLPVVVVGSSGLNSMTVAYNAGSTTANGSVVLGNYNVGNTYVGLVGGATGTAWDAAGASNWSVFDPGSTSAPATVASGALAQFADGNAMVGNTGSGPITVPLNSTRNVQGIQFSSTMAGHNYTLQDAGGGTGNIILDNTGNSAPATISDVSAAGNVNTISLPITLNSPLAVSVANAANTVTLGGVVSGAQPLTKTGLGTLVLSGPNTYSGTTTIGSNAGIVQITNTSALGTGNVALTTTNSATSQGTLQLNLAGGTPAAPNVIANNITGNSQNTLSSSTPGFADLESLSGANQITGTYTITGTGGSGQNIVTDAGSSLELAGALSTTITNSTNARTFDFGGAGSTLVSGVIANGTVAPIQVQKDGAGTLTLSATNTYTGTTTVNAGSVLVSGSVGSAATPAGVVTVGANGTLGGAGTSGTGMLTVSSATVNGILAPGATLGATTGTLTLNTTTGLTINGTLAIGVVAGGTGTLLATNGLLTLGNASTLTISGTLDGTSNYDIANYGTRSGTFANLTVPANYTINYSGTSFAPSGEEDIELDAVTPVPEPSTWLFIVLATAASGLYWRRYQARNH